MLKEKLFFIEYLSTLNCRATVQNSSFCAEFAFSPRVHKGFPPLRTTTDKHADLKLFFIEYLSTLNCRATVQNSSFCAEFAFSPRVHKGFPPLRTPTEKH